MQHAYESDVLGRMHELAAHQRIGQQGWPLRFDGKTGDVDTDMLEAVAAAARTAVRATFKATAPWIVVPDDADLERDEKAGLAGEAEELIAAWREVFEPDNVASG